MPFRSCAAAAAVHRSISQPGPACGSAVAGLSLLALLVAACGGGSPAEVSVLWRLSDGRSCVDTSVVRTVAEVEREHGEKWERFRDRYGDWGRDVPFTLGSTRGA